MDKLIEFVISNLQPAIDSIKSAAPEIIRREAEWIIWASKLEIGVGVICLVMFAGVIAAAIFLTKKFAHEEAKPYSCGGWADHVGFAVLFVLGGLILIIAGLVCTLDGIITLKHMRLNPTYMLIKHFMPVK